jgi:predicted DNA-binding protein with PD1-like motif
MPMFMGHVGRMLVFRILEDEDLDIAIRKRAEESGVKAGFFVLIGALKNVAVGCYNKGVYEQLKFTGPLEIASCTGNIAVDERDNLVIHAHLVVSNEKGQAFGGHLMEGSHVGATAELMIIEGTGLNLVRSFDERTNLKLLRLS